MDAEPAPVAEHVVPDRTSVLRRRDLVLCLLLLVQFVLGMVVNLFVTIPAKHPGSHPAGYLPGITASIGWAVPDGGGWLAVHVTLGLALVLAGIAGVVAAVRYGQRGPIVAATLGFLAIVGAAFNGASFLSYNNDYSSMIMAGCFALALACYVIGLYQCSIISLLVDQHPTPLR